MKVEHKHLTNDKDIIIQVECFDIEYRGGGVELMRIDEEKPAFCGYAKDQLKEESEKLSPSKTKPIHKQKQSPSKKQKPKTQTQKQKQKRTSKPKKTPQILRCYCRLLGCKRVQNRTYCGCFKADRKCTSLCQCFDCENVISILPQPEDSDESIMPSQQENENSQFECSPQFEAMNFETCESSSKICECKEGCVGKICPCFVGKSNCGNHCGCSHSKCKNTARQGYEIMG